MDKTALGDRMKMYEKMEAGRMFMPLVPVLARIDGRSFSKFTKGMNRPYDTNFNIAMDRVTQYLVEQTNPVMAYVQSDEINLLFYSEDVKSQIFFNGKIHKMTSQLAALATAKMVEAQQKLWPNKPLPTFDARVWTVPNKMEAMNNFLWRQRDAIKNSVSMLASEHFSPKELHGKSHNERLDMLCRIGVLWQNEPARFKSGVYIRKEPYELECGAQRTRAVGHYYELDKLENRVEFIFGDDPKVISEVI